jgi:anti-sigma B factor antagonist
MEPLHEDRVVREEIIRDYVLRRLDPARAEAFESHYLACDECFEELRVSHLLAVGLALGKVRRRWLGDVVVFDFTEPASLTRSSPELGELLSRVLEQKDTKVLIDLGRVSRIDSAGLGSLMRCYSRAVQNRGALKLLNPGTEIRSLLRLTRIDSVLESYDDERQAFESFRPR